MRKRNLPPKEQQFPRLFKKTRRGQIAWYKIDVWFYEEHAEIHTTKAVDLSAKTQVDAKAIYEGVNIGKSNETTLWEQANLRAESMYNKLRDDGYKSFEDITGVQYKDSNLNDSLFRELLLKNMSETNSDSSGSVKPMLAEKAKNDYHSFPVFIQPKYDGMRCIAHIKADGVYLQSRKGKPILKMDHICEDLKNLRVGTILDGELYAHKTMSFQKIISNTRKSVNEATTGNLVKYYIYDVVDVKSNFTKRLDTLRRIFELNKFSHCILSKTIEVSNKKDLDSNHFLNVEDGYEGSMLRTPNGLYSCGFRSNDLLKVKDFDENEFKLIGMEEASGRDEGTALFILQTADGKKFTSRPQGDFELREWYWTNRKKIIKDSPMVTVKYQGLTDSGIPRFNSSKCIRDYE